MRLSLVSDQFELEAKARMCRRLAKSADERTSANLLMLAVDFEAQADKLAPPGPPPETH